MNIKLIRDMTDIAAKALVATFCGYFIYERYTEVLETTKDSERKTKKIGFETTKKIAD